MPSLAATFQLPPSLLSTDIVAAAFLFHLVTFGIIAALQPQGSMSKYATKKKGQYKSPLKLSSNGLGRETSSIEALQ